MVMKHFHSHEETPIKHIKSQKEQLSYHIMYNYPSLLTLLSAIY